MGTVGSSPARMSLRTVRVEIRKWSATSSMVSSSVSGMLRCLSLTNSRVLIDGGAPSSAHVRHVFELMRIVTGRHHSRTGVLYG